MELMKSSFVVFLLLSYWTQHTLQQTPDSNESHEDSDETNDEAFKKTSEQAMNLKLLQMTEKDQIGNLTNKLMEEFIEKATDEIHAINRAVHEQKKNLVLSGFQLLAKRLVGSATILEQSKCSKQLGERMKSYLLQGRGYIRNCPSVVEVLNSFKEWVKFTFEMLNDLKSRLETDNQHCQKQKKKKRVEDCFLNLFLFNEDRKRIFREDSLKKLRDKADIATDYIEENWFMCTLRCMDAAKKMNAILEKIIKLQLTEADIFSNCDMFMGVVSTTFKMRPQDSGLEPYFREIKEVSLNGLENPYHAYMVDF